MVFVCFVALEQKMETFAIVQFASIPKVCTCKEAFVENENTLLEFKDITKIYPGVVALNKVNIKVKKGEIHGLIGENGAGKSTLIKTLAGAHLPTSGEVLYEGNHYCGFTPEQAMKLGIACIYQELNQVPYMTVSENIFLGREILKRRNVLDLKKQEQETRKLLEEFDLDIDPNIELGLLGVGTRQMIEICKAAHANAKLVILDEPSASLSEKETKQLFKIMGKLKDRGVTQIYISHRLEEVLAICDSLTVLRDGELVKDSIPIGEVTIDKMVSLMVGHDIKQKYPKKTFPRGKVMLEVRNLTGERAYKDVSFKAYAGEILGISGLVGAGRTEMARGITGADRTVSGEVFVKGKKVNIKCPSDSINAGIAFLTEDRKSQGLVLLQSVEFNSTLVALGKFRKHGFLDLAGLRKATEVAVNNMRIKVPCVYTLAGSLSGGNQQKVVVAKWIMTNCDIFIFDEPTRGIDVGAKVEVYNLVNDLLAAGKAVIMISSEMDECMGMADRIMVMHEGNVMGTLERKDFTQEKLMYAASGIGFDKQQQEVLKR